jgi:hypothetical protein
MSLFGKNSGKFKFVHDRGAEGLLDEAAPGVAGKLGARGGNATAEIAEEDAEGAGRKNTKRFASRVTFNLIGQTSTFADAKVMR